MAKNRMVRPETWTDDKFVSLDPLARLLFVGMWNFACDNGHLDDSALQLKMRVLPADNCDVSELLDSLLASGMVVRKDGYLKVVNLAAKQPLDLRFLVFCDHCDQDDTKHFSREAKKPSREPHAGNTRATRGQPRVALRSGVGVGVGVERHTSTADASDEFDEFWTAYPRKDAKGSAAKAHRAALKKTDHATILAGLQSQMPVLTKTERKFVPLPATWLNAERWADEVAPPEARSPEDRRNTGEWWV